MTTHERVDAIFREAREDVYYYVLTLGLAPAQAQEVTQEVFLRLFVTMRGGEEVLNPRAWVFRVAHNLGLKTKSKERHSQEFSPELENVLAHPDDNSEQQILLSERDRRLREAIRELSPQQRQVLHLRAEGLRYQEIAETLGIATSTVGEFLRRALNRLRKVLHE
ncbi:MAG TPA: RNA polymerase sigma factor [Bryobacteraceae bacterium]|nr:RNA polymerase sigma factor [Bryobacteraceae bacterium]